MNELKLYLWGEWRVSNLPKYYKYFQEWFDNLTMEQVEQYLAYMNGKKTIL